MNTSHALRACLLALSASPLLAGDLRIRDVAVHRSDAGTRVELTIGWSNAWHNERNHDAAWVVLRAVDEPERGLLRLREDGHRAIDPDPDARITVGDDRLGVFIAPAETHRGDVEWRVALELADSDVTDVDAWAVEMVYIPAGAFELGDDATDAVRRGAFYRSDADGRPAGTYRVASEAAIEVGPKAGQLNYVQGRNPQYVGDRQGPIPAEFPKGTRAFYLMKYELTQGDYAAFLNALPEPWRAARANHEAEGAEAETNSIELDGERFVALAPRRPANFVSWDDTCAFTDWMGLRPMTELEFEKACRGPHRPCPLDFAWGTADRDELEQTVERTRDLAHSSIADEAKLTDETRPVLGASFYWVMNLSDSMWERTISAGHADGRAFRGTHGDGVLEDGDATNADWPRIGDDPRAADGIAYRGGAEYFTQPGARWNERVAVRTYGGWNGAFRYKTYSARACRTAPAKTRRR